MIKFTGNIDGSVDSVPFSSPMVLQNFTLVNKTGGAVTCNVYMISGARTVSIAPLNKSINTGEIYTDEIPRLIDNGEVVRLATTGSVDYLFNIENTIAP